MVRSYEAKLNFQITSQIALIHEMLMMYKQANLINQHPIT